MMTTVSTNQVINHLEFVFNRKDRKSWEFGLYDHSGSYTMKQLRQGIVFNTTIETLNQIGFDLWSITSYDDYIVLVIKDRRVKN